MSQYRPGLYRQETAATTAPTWTQIQQKLRKNITEHFKNLGTAGIITYVVIFCIWAVCLTCMIVLSHEVSIKGFKGQGSGFDWLIVYWFFNGVPIFNVLFAWLAYTNLK